MDPIVTFVIPTTGRDSLGMALDSLGAQTDEGWAALVVSDGVEPETMKAHRTRVADDNRITFIGSRKRGSAGLTRNVGLPYVRTKWTGFLDDDDMLATDYVRWLRGYGREHDVVVFRMYHPELGVLPPMGMKPEELRWGQVGISFAVRSAYFGGPSHPERDMEFISESDPDNPTPGMAQNEDIRLLEELRERNARFVIADEIGYFVGGQQ